MMINFRRTTPYIFTIAIFTFTMPGLSQTKVSLRQLEANGFSNGCVVATSGVLSTQTCSSASGAGDAGGYTVVSFSSVPVFPVTKNTGQLFLLTLTGDVASSTVDTSGLTNSGRPIVTFHICQDHSGAHSFTWPPNVQNHGTVELTASSCSSQTFVYDGTNFQALGNLLVTGMSSNAIVLPGSTSGSTKLQASATANGTLTLPARTAILATTSGSLTDGHCSQFDASGNLTDSGSACGGGGGGAGPFVTVKLRADKQLLQANGHPSQDISWDATVEDTSSGSMWSGTHPERLVAPTSGHYQVIFSYNTTSLASFSPCFVHHAAADGTVLETTQSTGGAAIGGWNPMSGTWVFNLAAGDWVTINAYIGDASEPTLPAWATFAQMFKIGN
jgi:hypothetical protein